MARRMIMRAAVAAAAVVGLLGLASPAWAYPSEILPEQDVYLFSDYYVGINWTGWSIDAMANCQADADRLNGGAYRARCTPQAYGARLDVYQVR
jgi:hypothetical protein